MEYLTIQDPRQSLFRGMDPYSSEGFGSLSRDILSRPLRAPSFERMRSSSPNLSHRSRPSAGSSHGWQRGSPPLGSSLPPSSHQLFSATTSIHLNPAPSSRGERSLSPSSGYGATVYSPDRSKPSMSEWSKQLQAMPQLPPAPSSHPCQSAEESQSCKLPSFSSLVEQLDRKPAEPSASSKAYSASVESSWSRQETPGSFTPLEPPPFQFSNHQSSNRTSLSSSAALLPAASSEPTSPHGYPGHPHSPRKRAQSPRVRGHSRRSSDYRVRAFSQLSQPPASQEAPLPTFSGSHHRTQTFPSFPMQQQRQQQQQGLGQPSRPDPFQPQLPPQQHFALVPPPSHAGSIPGRQSQHLGHSRTDSVLTTTEDYGRFYSSSFHATGSSAGHYQRKRRGNLPKDATKILRQWFDEHLEAPYPGEEVKNMLCVRTGLQMSQVNNWFINARRRLPRVDTNRNRRERDSTDVSDGSPSRDRQTQPPAYS